MTASETDAFALDLAEFDEPDTFDFEAKAVAN